MLYPKEDKANRQLLYSCRLCDHQEEAQDFCVYRNEVKAAIEYAWLAYSVLTHLELSYQLLRQILLLTLLFRGQRRRDVLSAAAERPCSSWPVRILSFSSQYDYNLNAALFLTRTYLF